MRSSALAGVFALAAFALAACSSTPPAGDDAGTPESDAGGGGGETDGGGGADAGTDAGVTDAGSAVRYHFVTDTLTVPLTQNQAKQLAFDVDSDPQSRADNALGSVIATLDQDGGPGASVQAVN